MSDGPEYDYAGHKTVIALSNDLEAGVALNVAAHLAVSLGAYGGADLMGRRWLVDASGVQHAGISRYPVVITKVKRNRLRQLLDEARAMGDEALYIADYPEAMLTTGHDDQLATELAAVPETAIAYLGVLIYGPADPVSKLTGRFMLWK